MEKRRAGPRNDSGTRVPKNFNSDAPNMLRLLSRFFSLLGSLHGAAACLRTMLDVHGLSSGEVSCFFSIVGVVSSHAIVWEACKVVDVSFSYFSSIYKNQVMCKYRVDPQRAGLTSIAELTWSNLGLKGVLNK